MLRTRIGKNRAVNLTWDVFITDLTFSRGKNTILLKDQYMRLRRLILPRGAKMQKNARLMIFMFPVIGYR